MKIYNHIWETIGNTPLVRIPNLSAKYNVQADILLKLEFFNPLSSVKDRLALALIEAGEQTGKITKDTVIIEPTSGNTGIGLAFICAAKGYRLILTMPETMSFERRRMLKLFGAELVLTSAEDGINGAVSKAEELLKEHTNSYMPQQFKNLANPAIHNKTTAEEIWRDTDGAADILIAGIGTGGTLTGISQKLKSYKPNFQTIAVEPLEKQHKIQGIGPGFIPDVLDTSLIDETFKVPSDEAINMCHETASTEGIPVGLSAGAAIYTALKVGQRPEMQGKMMVVIVPSMAERYLSLPAFKGLCE